MLLYIGKPKFVCGYIWGTILWLCCCNNAVVFTSNNLLGCLSRESAVVKLYDVTTSYQSADDVDFGVVERYVKRTSAYFYDPFYAIVSRVYFVVIYDIIAAISFYRSCSAT